MPHARVLLLLRPLGTALTCAAVPRGGRQVIFRNASKLLADAASSEFLFCLDFWEDEGAFRELAGPVVAVVEEHLAAALQVARQRGLRG